MLPPMHAIRLDNVSKHYADYRATDAVSLAIEPGQFAVVLGPSGCGKTTLLRLVAGLEHPDEGRIELHGRDVTRLPPGHRELGMVFQSYALFPHLSVGENLLFGLKLRRTSRAERERRLDETARLLGLETLLARKPAQLSGGQQQRVALGRAIIGGRRTVLMDEPLSNLDAKLRHEMRRELRSLARELDMTVLYVTHDQAEALGMGDVVVVMNQGRIEQIASPEKLYEHPESLFVARFIGTPPMNLLPLESGPSLEGTDHALGFLADGEGQVLGLRPEQLEVTRPGNGIEAVVEAVEYLGADAVLSCRAGRHELSARVPGRLRPQPGESLFLGWKPHAVNLFDAASGRRLPDPPVPLTQAR
jgi:sn-glycerol 3-phosphate transport system ATP-binding protein